VSREGPVPIASDLERFLEALGVPQVSLLVSLHKAWPGIAGTLLAGKAYPLKFRNGVLTIGVRNHSWAQELQMSRPALLSKINDALGPKSPVTDLRFTVGPVEDGEPEAPSAEPPEAEAPATGPDPEGLAGVADPEIRASLRAIHLRARPNGKSPGG
jgi:hypothetical protein